MFHLYPIYTLSPYTTLFRSTLLSGTDAVLKLVQPVVVLVTKTVYGLGAPTGPPTPVNVTEVPITAPLTVAPLYQFWVRSEEHTSELQSLRHLVCRLLLEKKK